MDLLVHKDFDLEDFAARFPRVLQFLKNREFAPLDVKKFEDSGYYRVKLDYQARLLFRFGKYEGKTYLLLLELIENHDYAGSRFLRHHHLEEGHLLPVKTESLPETAAPAALQYVNPHNPVFHYQNRFISFDDSQAVALDLQPPLVLIGSAGSGKTALLLEKMKDLQGRILYVTLSAHLAQNSATLFNSLRKDDEKQVFEFLSFAELIETLHVPEGRELTLRDFEKWFHRHRNFTSIKDAHRLYEEFRGVITGTLTGHECLSREEYRSLGVKQSILPAAEREEAYSVFEKYREFLHEGDYFDLNILSHQWLQYVKKEYDYVVVDEVQDITNVQLHLILSCLRKAGQFILCGDSNQIVHANFFSWTRVKNLLFEQQITDRSVHILTTNYRNSIRVTHLANQLLRIKTARFGSIDRESSYLVNTVSGKEGEVVLLDSRSPRIAELNAHTRSSIRFAVIVMRPEDKREAREMFQTPLIFSVHESKGLEYENVILLNFVSHADREFRAITEGVSHSQIKGDESSYSRAADKTDKSLEVYKFYINSLYVAITRSLGNVYLVERQVDHEIFDLLELTDHTEKVKLRNEVSSEAEWRKEAQRLKAQGKTEQAEAIGKSMLPELKPIPWVPLTPGNLEELRQEALYRESYNKKAKDKLYDYALFYQDQTIFRQLLNRKYSKSNEYEQHINGLMRRYYPAYHKSDVETVLKESESYGLDFRDQFNLTPLMVATFAGDAKLVKALIQQGADITLNDNTGRTCLQIALFLAFESGSYFMPRLKSLYHLLAPPCLKLRLNQKLVMLGAGKLEYLMFNSLFVFQHYLIGSQRALDEPEGVRAEDLENLFSHLPDTILPPHRKKFEYLRSHLARHETSREKGSLRLYTRLQRGYYVLNPDLEMQMHGEWLPLKEILQSVRAAKEQKLQQLMKVFDYFPANPNPEKHLRMPKSVYPHLAAITKAISELVMELDGEQLGEWK